MSFIDQLKQNLIEKDRWLFLLQGLGRTLIITVLAAIIGLIIGIIVSSIRTSYDKNQDALKRKGGIAYVLISVLNWLCKLYLTIFRGTPVVVQLMIFYFVIFASWKNGIYVAIIVFGINSGAYVTEIFRGGVMAIDKGQFEAGRSIGFNYIQTMIHIIIPQVVKAVLPTILNEFIALLKETSIAGYVGIVDLTRAGDKIRSRTFSAFIPLIAVAIVYLIMVLTLTWIVGKIERRLRKSDH